MTGKLEDLHNITFDKDQVLIKTTQDDHTISICMDIKQKEITIKNKSSQCVVKEDEILLTSQIVTIKSNKVNIDSN